MSNVTRKFFHWKYSGVLIPFFAASGIATVYLAPSLPPSIDLKPVFTLGYIFFISSWVWAIGYWLTSDGLRKKNPLTWNRNRRNQGGIRAKRLYLCWKWGCSALITLPFVAAIITINRFQDELELVRPGGWLTPASEPTPDAGPCGAPPLDALMVYLGSEAIIAQRFPHPVMRVNGKDFLTVFKTSDGHVAVSVDILGADQKLIARIDRNYFTVVTANVFRQRGDADHHSIIVEDSYGTEVLNVRYLNPHALRIKALLWLPGVPATYGPWDAREDKITGCFGDGARLDFKYSP